MLPRKIISLLQLATRIRFPEEHTRRAQRQAQDVRRGPKQVALIGVGWDLLASLAIVDVRHALVDVHLLVKVEKLMGPLSGPVQWGNGCGIQHQVPAHAWVTMPAGT